MSRSYIFATIDDKNNDGQSFVSPNKTIMIGVNYSFLSGALIVADHHQILQIRAMREDVARRSWTVTTQVKEVGFGTVRREIRTGGLLGSASNKTSI